jgi:polysaccharide biosynthesis transport protein
MMRAVNPSMDWSTDPPPTSSGKGNRRRLLVFVGTFVAAMLIGQAWNLGRVDEYRTSTRLQVKLSDAAGSLDGATAATFANRVALVNSRPVLGRLAERMSALGMPLPGAVDQQVGALKSMLEVQPIAGSEVLQVLATGADARRVADVLNVLPEVIRAELSARQIQDADERLARARQELTRLESRAQERRAKLDQFRLRAGVLAERDDNEPVAMHKGLTTALNNAIEKEAAAAARLRALTEAVAEGRMSTTGRPDPTLSGLETKAHQVREDLREMERVFTPAFLQMDPKAQALRVRLAELERQIRQQREQGQTGALQAAREDLAGAQAQVARLREQRDLARPKLNKVNARLSDAKVLEDDLAQVEKARRDLLERVARLEANEQRRAAGVVVVEAAVAPTSPFQPDKFRDGLWVLGASLLGAALVMALVEVFNRPPPVMAASPGTTTVVLSPGWAGAQALPHAGADARSLPYQPQPQPAGQALFGPAQQVLAQAEAAALVAATGGLDRVACALGLLGLTAEEALAVVRGDVMSERQQVQVRGPWARSIPAPAWLATSLSAGESSHALLCDAVGQPMQWSDLQAMLVSGALDAGLPCGPALSWDVLRATCIDWLLGQGLRYSELTLLVGRVDVAQLSALSQREGVVPHRLAKDVEFLMPALRVDPRSIAAAPTDDA